MRINAGRVPSTRIHVSRVNKQVRNHGRWAKNSNAVPTATNRHIESRTHYSLPRELTDIPISSHQTRRANDLHNQALRLSHSDDHGPKPTWWHTSSRSNAGISTIRAKKINSAGRFTSNLHVDRLDKFAIIAALDKPDQKLASNTSRLVPDAKVVVSRSLKGSNTLPSDVSNLEKKNLGLLEDQLSKMPRIQCAARQDHLRIHFSLVSLYRTLRSRRRCR